MKRNGITILGLCCSIGILLLIACQKDENTNPSGPAQLILSPDSLMLNDIDTGLIFLSVQPAEEFQWNVSAKPDWLEIQPNAGTVHNQILQLQVVPDPVGLSPGKYAGVIEIITNGAGKGLTNIVLCVDPHPRAELQPNPVIIEAHEAYKDITLKNIGTGFLNWHLQSVPTWLGLSYSLSPLEEGDSTNIRLIANRTGLPAGTQTGQMLVVSNSEGGNIAIDLVMHVPTSAQMTVSPENLEVGYFDDKKSFYIINEGNISFNWNFDPNSNSFLSANPSMGSVAAGDSAEVELLIDRTNLTSQIHEVEFIIQNDQGQSITVPTQINHYAEDKWLIDGRVIDAEYDRIHDVLVVVSENPNQIRKFNLSAQTFSSLDLNLPPTCVSVGTDGLHAAVGHQGSFAYVDLAAMTMVQHYAVTTNALDIVLAPNDWVYVFPKVDQWENIRCIRLATGAETLHTGGSIYAGTVARLHPSGDYMYGANNGLSPSDFEKYDISNGTASYLYDSPYHGNYDFYGNIWISEDGNRLFAKSRNVFNSSTNENIDMTYNGELAGEGKVKTLDFSLNAGKIYAVFSTSSPEEIPYNEVRIYETGFLAFQGTIPLPGFLIPDGTGDGTFYDSQGHFGFFNSSGTEYYVLVKVEDGSGAQNEWAIATLDVE